MFVEGMDGTLMELAEAPETRFRYVVWFDYTRRAINEIQEGTLLAAPNFASDNGTKRYSVLEVATSVGFDSVSAFARAFVRFTGETPSAYRRRVTT